MNYHLKIFINYKKQKENEIFSYYKRIYYLCTGYKIHHHYNNITKIAVVLYVLFILYQFL